MSLSITKAIYSILSGDTTVQSYVGSKVYAIFAPDEVLVPLIVFTKTNVTATYTKDGHIYDDVIVNIKAVSDNYTECINISEAIRSALESITGEYSGIYIYQSLLNSASEEFGVDGYIATLEFAIRCN